jgi:hypothetical protein
MATLDIGNLCVWCEKDTAFGSGRFVNRIPVSTRPDSVEWLEEEDKGIYDWVEGYGCAECYDEEKED